MRIQANHENLVAVMAMGGKRPEVVIPLSRNTSELQRKLFAVQPAGTADPLTTIRIAQLIYQAKKRKKTNLELRLMLFLGSLPTAVTNGHTRLLELARQLRQNNVKVDMVAFGAPDETGPIVELFQPFVDELGESSQLVIAKPSQDFYSVVFNKLNSLIGQGRVNIPGLTSPDVGFMDEADQDLMMAIMLSLQEANQAKRTAVTEKVVEPSKDCASTSMSNSTSSTTTPTSSPIKSVVADAKIVEPNKTRFPTTTVESRKNRSSSTILETAKVTKEG